MLILKDHICEHNSCIFLQLIFCNLQSCHQFYNINFTVWIVLLSASPIIFLKLLLRVSKKIICVIWRNFTEWHTTFSSLQNMESMLLSFNIRRSYHSCNLAAAKSKESFGSTNQRPGAPISYRATNQTSRAPISRELRNRDTIYKRNFKSRPSIDVSYYDRVKCSKRLIRCKMSPH